MYIVGLNMYLIHFHKGKLNQSISKYSINIQLVNYLYILII